MSLTFKRPSPKRTPKERDAEGNIAQRFPTGYKQVRHPGGAVTMVRVDAKPVKGKAAVKLTKRLRKNPHTTAGSSRG